MSNSTDDNTGCVGCLSVILFLLGFSHYGWWILLGLIIFSNWQALTMLHLLHPRTRPIPPIPDDLDNILKDLSMGDIKDPITLDKFRPGETVYLCHVHRLAYHEDSWRSVGCQCDVCGNNSHIKQYTVPLSIPIRQRDISHLIQFRDLDE